MEIKLSEEQLAESVTKAITASVMGDKLKEMIEKEVDSAIKGSSSYPYRESVVSQVVQKIISDAVREEVFRRQDEIKQMIAEKLTGEMISDMVQKLWDASLRSDR